MKTTRVTVYSSPQTDSGVFVVTEPLKKDPDSTTEGATTGCHFVDFPALRGVAHAVGDGAEAVGVFAHDLSGCPDTCTGCSVEANGAHFDPASLSTLTGGVFSKARSGLCARHMI
ncbi:MAG: hypothetical protein JKY23_05370 [Nitrospinaceae bacterium]|nr:hypothetical protein [Nitrospinaceae bacterium]